MVEIVLVKNSLYTCTRVDTESKMAKSLAQGKLENLDLILMRLFNNNFSVDTNGNIEILNIQANVLPLVLRKHLMYQLYTK